HHPARAADQWRRERNLYELLGDTGRQLHDHRDLPAWHRSGHRASADAKPRSAGATPPARGGEPDRIDRAETLAGPDDGGFPAFEGWSLRLALPAHLRGHTDPGRAGAPARHG